MISLVSQQQAQQLQAQIQVNAQKVHAQVLATAQAQGLKPMQAQEKVKQAQATYVHRASAQAQEKIARAQSQGLVSSLVLGNTSSAVSGGPFALKSQQEALELHYQGLRLIRSISKLHPSWLASQTVIIECLRKLWRSPARIQRLLAHDRLPINFHLESKLLIKCFIMYSRLNPGDVQVLLDMVSVFFLHRTPFDFSFLQTFYRDEVATKYSAENKCNLIDRFCECFVSLGRPRSSRLSVWHSADSEAYIPPPAARTRVGNAQISTYSSDNSGKIPVIRTGLRGCSWSARFEADPKRLSWQDECITPRSAGNTASSGCVLYELGVSADYATRHFGSVTLVSVIPRYMILNRSQRTLLLLETSHRQLQRPEASINDNVVHHVLGPGDMYALYWVCEPRALLRTSVLINKEASDSICEESYDWSEAFDVDRAGTTYLLVPPRARGRDVHLEVVVKQGRLSQATFLLVVSDLSANSPASPPSGLLAASSLISSSTKNVVAERGWQTFSFHAQMTGVIITITETNTEE
ncbi:hypothetical protein PsorP6_003896 [Peronosclerospora sorghi]|uniref:Uncharacterized protein n=1 Tax=Peronosclerospora sorghi TaxID=230839 RepID=A0ACC0VL05_9STRA|nr:hypothetical protein PsorP6_003896 [Peronosclerospora sorghi]